MLIIIIIIIYLFIVVFITMYIIILFIVVFMTMYIIIIIFINCNWIVTRWQWFFTCKQNMKLVITKFKSGGLHEKHVAATWNLGNHLSICL